MFVERSLWVVNMRKLSIVIATYNADKTLKQALDSVRYQTYKNIELIVVDGGSSDKTMEIVKEYSDVVSKWTSERDNGIYEAFNKGIDLATGDYICFLGADDCYCNYHVISKIMEEVDDSVDLISAPIKIVNCLSLKESIMRNRKTKEEVFSGNMIPHPGMFTKLGVMKKYRFNESNKIISDYEFLVRYLLDGGHIKFVDFPVAFFAKGGTSGGKFGSLGWQQRLCEHIVLADNVGLDKEYRYKVLANLINFRKRNSTFFHLEEAIKLTLDKIGVLSVLRIFEKYIRTIFGMQVHKCDLKYCRWCGRNVENNNSDSYI